MTKIKRNSKGFYIIFGIIDGLLVISALVLLFFSLIYHGNLAPKLFSHRVYIMDTEAFSLVEKGSAVIADQVDFSQVLPGNIVIFTDGNEKAAVGEVQKSLFEDNVYTFTVKNDVGAVLTVGQSHILGKGVYYSKFLGGLVSFATSPLGVLCIAILPCVAFVVWEVVAAVKRKAPQPTVTTIKKQYETPTYIPPGQNKEKDLPKEDQIPLEDRIAFAEERHRLVEAAGLYAPSPKKGEPAAPAPSVPQQRPTVSGKEIDKLIQEAKAKRMSESAFDGGSSGAVSSADPRASTQRTPSATPVNVAKSAYERIQKSSDLPPDSYFDRDAADRKARSEDIFKPMELDIDDKPLRRLDDGPSAYSSSSSSAPSAARQQPKHSHTRSSPRLSRLDSLLQEESSNDSKYDINNILRNIEKK